VCTLYSAFVKSGAAKKAQEKRTRDSESTAVRLKKAKTLSSGVLAKMGIHSLNDEAVRSEVHDRQVERVETVKKQKLDRHNRSVKLLKAVEALREKYGDEKVHLFSKCTKDECGSYLQYKKKPGRQDPAMPKDLEERRQRCIEWIGRLSPASSPHASDDEGDADDDVDGVSAVSAMAGVEVDSSEDVDEYGEPFDGAMYYEAGC
jgi:hypothetical protein